MPVLCHLLEAQHFTDIHQIENVFLEAAATKANRSRKELGPHTGVCTNRVCNLQFIKQKAFFKMRFATASAVVI